MENKATLNGCRYVADNVDGYLEQAHAIAVLLEISVEADGDLSGLIVRATARALSSLIECAAVAARLEREVRL